MNRQRAVKYLNALAEHFDDQNLRFIGGDIREVVSALCAPAPDPITGLRREQEEKEMTQEDREHAVRVLRDIKNREYEQIETDENLHKALQTALTVLRREQEERENDRARSNQDY